MEHTNTLPALIKKPGEKYFIGVDFYEKDQLYVFTVCKHDSAGNILVHQTGQSRANKQQFEESLEHITSFFKETALVESRLL